MQFYSTTFTFISYLVIFELTARIILYRATFGSNIRFSADLYRFTRPWLRIVDRNGDVRQIALTFDDLMNCPAKRGGVLL